MGSWLPKEKLRVERPDGRCEPPFRRLDAEGGYRRGQDVTCVRPEWAKD